MSPDDLRTDYLSKVYDVDKFVNVVDSTVRILKRIRRKIPFDAIAFTGCSGAAVAYPLSYRMELPLLCVRKVSEKSHYIQDGNGEIEGFIAAKRYLIIDDFMCSGDTIHRIIDVIAKEMPEAECVAIACYTVRPTDPETAERGPIHHSFKDRNISVPTFGTYEEKE